MLYSESAVSKKAHSLGRARKTSGRGMWEEQSCDCAWAYKASLCVAKYNPCRITRENVEGSHQLRWNCRWRNKKSPNAAARPTAAVSVSLRRRPLTAGESGSARLDCQLRCNNEMDWKKRFLLGKMDERSLELNSWQSGCHVRLHGLTFTRLTLD